MGVESTITRKIAAKLFVRLKKNLVYGNTVNREFEGELKKGGNAILINEVSPVTMTDYTKNTDVTWTQASAVAKELRITEAKYFAKTEDDLDKVQSFSNVMNGLIEEASYAAADTIDQFLSAYYSKAGNSVTALTVTAGNAMLTLSRIQTQLLEANVKGEIFMPIPPWLHQHLVNAASASITPTGAPKLIGNSTLLEGFVGKLYGMNLMISNNVNNNGTIWNAMAYSRQALTFAVQIQKTKYTADLESQFGSGVKALYVYGAKMVRPNAACSCAMTKG